MRFNPSDKAPRESLRLPGYDYSTPGAYFVTIRLAADTTSFSRVTRGGLVLTDAGRMLCQVWESFSERFEGIRMDVFVVMPDHVHGIILIHRCIDGEGSSDLARRQDPSLSRIMQAYKSLTTRHYSDGVREHKWEPFSKRMWERNYYERIINGPDDLEVTRKYIRDNPTRYWKRAQESSGT
jgi:REP element-mobilizing transposase RayT